MVNHSGRDRVEIKICHNITAYQHSAPVFIKPVDHLLQHTGIRIKIIRIKLNGKPATMFRQQSPVPASSDFKTFIFFNLYQHKSGIFNSFQQLACAVAACVVNNYYVERKLRRLRQSRFHSVSYCRNPIAHRNYHGSLHFKLTCGYVGARRHKRTMPSMSLRNSVNTLSIWA